MATLLAVVSRAHSSIACLVAMLAYLPFLTSKPRAVSNISGVVMIDGVWRLEIEWMVCDCRH